MASQVQTNQIVGIANPAGDGMLTKSVAGSADITLSSTEYINNYYVFTGVITGNINVIFPASGTWKIDVFNSTTGAFTLTVKAASGTGIVVATAKKAVLRFDSTNVIRLTADI